MEAKEKIRSYIKKNLIRFDDDLTIKDEDNIFLNGFVNSLFAMKLLHFVEREFSVTIEDDEIELSNFSSIERIYSLLQMKKAVA